MNIFGILKEYLKGNDNFSIISKHLTLIYLILHKYHKDSFSDDASLFQKCGEIDLQTYIKDGTISIKDINSSITLAQIGQCSISLISRSHVEAVDLLTGKKKRDILTNFIMQLLCLIFKVDNPSIGPKDILDAVISKKKAIQKCINETNLNFEKILNSKHGQETLIAVNMFMTGKMFPDKAEVTSSNSNSKSEWVPKPFFENESKDEFRGWFSNVAPWNKLDARIIEALINKLYGNPMFELVVHTSKECELIQKYIPLVAYFDKSVGDVAICPHIARLLYIAGEDNFKRLIQSLNSRKVNEIEGKKFYSRACDAFESSINVEPLLLPSYVQLASLKYRVGNKEEAKEFCNRGLEQVAKLKLVPFNESKLSYIKNTDDITSCENELNLFLEKLK